MFKRVLLCHDGTDIGRRALKQGAELAISVGAEVHVVILPPEQKVSASVMAGAFSNSLIDEDVEYRSMLSQSLERLKLRGVQAHGHLARGNAIQQIATLAASLAADLVVVGQYPSSRGRRWWASGEDASLADSVRCAVLIAVATD